MKNITKDKRIVLGLLVGLILPSLMLIESINTYFEGKLVFDTSYALETDDLNVDSLDNNNKENIEDKEEILVPDITVNFSFDGENAGFLLIDGSIEEDIQWEYSLDNEVTWNSVVGKSFKLLEEEILKINPTNDIKVKIKDINKIYVLDIIKNDTPILYSNDYENRIIGNITGCEWRYESTDKWISFETSKPTLTGNINIEIRKKATGLKANSDFIKLSFTEEIIKLDNKYISISEYKVLDDNYNKVIDGDINTVWTTNIESGIERNITIMLERHFYLSSLDILIPSIDEDNLKSIKLYSSLDGQEWELIRKYDFDEKTNVKSIELDDSIQMRFVKIVFAESFSDDKDVAIADLRFFEDTTKRLLPYAEIEYDITNFTNGNVVAKLINPSKEITITSDGGDTHVFTENGEFTFTFVDKEGNVGSRVARVNWIDRIIPTAELKYDIEKKTNKNVTVTIIPSEDVQVMNNEGKLSHTFIENGLFTFMFKDKAGNIGECTAEVNWIDKEAPITVIQYSTTEITTGSVMATLRANEDIIILNNEGKDYHAFEQNGEFEFAYSDIAGNEGKVVAKVDWIADKKANYSSSKPKTTTKTTTKKDVLKDSRIFNVENFTITIPSKDVRKDVVLVMSSLEFTDDLKSKVGDESEYLDIYFRDKNFEKSEIKSSMKMTIDLDKEKMFLGIYRVKDSDTVEYIEYKTVGSNKIEIEIESLGEFILSYKELEEEIDEKKNNSLLITIIILFVMFVAGLFVYKKSREEN